jgi:hypothetical protein
MSTIRKRNLVCAAVACTVPLISPLIAGNTNTCFARTMKAFIGKYDMPTTLDYVDDSLQLMDYSVTRKDSVSEDDLDTHLPTTHGVWYHFSHGHYRNVSGEWGPPGHYTETSDGWYHPDDLPYPLSGFKLVFMNACYSAVSPLGLVWKDKTNPAAYVGWTDWQENNSAAIFARYLFDYMEDGDNAVKAAGKADMKIPTLLQGIYAVTGNVTL